MTPRFPWLVLVAVVGAVLMAACDSGDDFTDDSPYKSLSPTRTLRDGKLDGPVDVVRDAHGLPHILATTEADAAFANGYVVAHDRLLQLNLIRHLARGRIGELFGALIEDQIDTDLTMRMHRFGARADAAVDRLRELAATDADAAGALTYLERFADGVNAYIAEAKADPSLIEPAAAAFFAPETISPWLPGDSLAIGYLQAWSLSYFTGDLDLTTVREAGRIAFDENADPARVLRKGAAFDLFPLEQLDKTSTTPGWPNVGTDSGTRAKRAALAPRTTVRPRVPMELLRNARRVVGPVQLFGMVFAHPEDGSNNWAVAGALGEGGQTIVANDPHLQLDNPPVFHFVHITVPGKLDVAGVSLAGVPGIVLGHNATLAWGATTSFHDVTDFYLEDIAPCASGGGDCVTFEGAEVKLERVTETFKIGALGTVTDSFDAVYEVVPHHGVILPIVENHRIAPRTAGQGISLAYTGDQDRDTSEFLALYRLQRATSVATGMDALDVFGFGSQNWMLGDDAGHIGWTTNARLPRRTAGCFDWDPIADPYAPAPFFVNPGDGACQWSGVDMDPRYIPHAVDPATGYLATANSDPVGETFDGDPLNGPVVDGAPLYAGYDYGPGLRTGRITRRLEELKAAGPITIDGMASVQGDTHSNVGELMRPLILAALDTYDQEGAPPDLAAYVATLSQAKKDRLARARTMLADWTLATPAAAGDDATPAEIADSAATVLFNYWQVAFYARAFRDELDLLESFPQRDYTIAAAIKLLTDPDATITGRSAVSGEAVLCDSLATPAVVESCTYMIIAALDATLDRVESDFGIEPTTWRWGKVHVARMPALVPVDDLNLPSPTGGYPRPGDSHAVDACNPSIGSYSFGYQHGPAMRNLMALKAGQTPVQRFALPGGQVWRKDSPHFRDLVDGFWSKNQYVDVPYTIEQVLPVAEERWLLRP